MLELRRIRCLIDNKDWRNFRLVKGNERFGNCWQLNLSVNLC